MARITPFVASLVEKNEVEPESIRLFRKLAESEDIRILLGDFFLRLAQNEPQDKENPHADLLRRMLGARDMACAGQLEILAKNLDLLRQYDIGRAAREEYRQKAANEPAGEESPAWRIAFADHAKAKDQ